MDIGVHPWVAFSTGFAEFPNIVYGTGPERGFAIIGLDDVWIVSRCVGGDAADQKETTIRAIVVDETVVSGNGAELREAAGIACGKLIEGAAGTEEIAFGRDFAGDTDRV